MTKPPPEGYRLGWKTSVLFGYAELGNDVADGVAPSELELIELELVEAATAATEVAAAVEESEELSELLAQGLGAFGSYEAG